MNCQTHCNLGTFAPSFCNYDVNFTVYLSQCNGKDLEDVTHEEAVIYFLSLTDGVMSFIVESQEEGEYAKPMGRYLLQVKNNDIRSFNLEVDICSEICTRSLRTASLDSLLVTLLMNLNRY